MPPSEKGPEPYLQGYLDKLCGVYAIINALQQVSGKPLSPRKAAAFFNLIVRELDSREKLVLITTTGMSIGMLEYLLSLTIYRFNLNGSQGITFNRPFLHCPKAKISELFAILEPAHQNACAIVRIIGNGRNHWTVLRGASGNKIRLSDSDECSDLIKGSIRFGRSSPKKGLCIPPSEVIVLERHTFSKRHTPV